MEIYFSDHALLKIEQRKIPISFVRQTVLSPDLRKPGYYPPRERWFRRFSRRYLEVVIVRQRKEIEVITAHWIRKLPL